MGQQSCEWKSSLNLTRERLHEETWCFQKQIQGSIICRFSQNLSCFFVVTDWGGTTEPGANALWYNWKKMIIMEQQFPWETALTSRTVLQASVGWESVRRSKMQQDFHQTGTKTTQNTTFPFVGEDCWVAEWKEKSRASADNPEKSPYKQYIVVYDLKVIFGTILTRFGPLEKSKQINPIFAWVAVGGKNYWQLSDVYVQGRRKSPVWRITTNLVFVRHNWSKESPLFETNEEGERV